MLFHVSIDAENPKRVAEVLAELWGGIATPFPPVMVGSWVAMAGDARNTIVEVYPRGTELVLAEGEAGADGRIGTKLSHSATHFAMATELDLGRVMAIADREGWPVKYCRRGGAFGVIELWIEGTRMVEVLTPEMQTEYLGAMTVVNWQRFMAGMGMMPETIAA